MWFLRNSINCLTVAGLILAAVASRPAHAQNPPSAPGDLVRKAIQNEIKADSDSSASFMFRSHKVTPRGSQTKLMVQTKDATAGMLVAVNDQPLNPSQKRAEEQHLQYIATHPDELKRKQRQERDDAERVRRILRAMPDAFLYEPDGSEPGKPGIGKSGDDLIRLKFRPNPRYDPPSRVEQVLTGMEGQILIDSERKRIAKIDGTLFRDVGFGWGILGHLDKGGRFQVEQGSVDDSGSWAMTRISLDFTGKVLLFKSIVLKSTETLSDFKRVEPSLSFGQGVTLLEKETAARTQDGGK